MDTTRNDDPILALARQVVTVRYDDLPMAAREAAKKCILDTMGVALAGASFKLGKTIADMGCAWGGAGECTVLGHQARLPAPHAVFVNAALARVTDLDAMDEVVGEHPAIAPVMAGLAAGEVTGNCTGKELITAVALATDFGIRLQSALQPEPGERPWCTGFYPPFAAAAAAGKVFAFAQDQMTDALGIAFGQLSGTWQTPFEAATVYQLQYALATKAGFVSAWLARHGVTGPHRIVSGEYGISRHYSVNGVDTSRLLGGLGERFLNTQATIKQYACGGGTHRAIQGLIEIARDHALKPHDIERIIVRVNRQMYRRTCEPLDVKRNPPSFFHAQFSIPYTVATAAVYGDVFLDQLSEKKWPDPRVLAVSNRVECIADPSLEEAGKVLTPVAVEVATRDGHVWRTRVERLKGHPDNPLSLEDCTAKFRNCARYCVSSLGTNNIERALAMLCDLEDVPNVADVTSLLRAT